ncbi:hypothetical protein Mapa_015512 [Marchantia paleacea]|nr:hypothetical protein Mapa_015512 [Marchantia paleacea]
MIMLQIRSSGTKCLCREHGQPELPFWQRADLVDGASQFHETRFLELRGSKKAELRGPRGRMMQLALGLRSAALSARLCLQTTESQITFQALEWEGEQLERKSTQHRDGDSDSSSDMHSPGSSETMSFDGRDGSFPDLENTEIIGPHIGPPL